MYCSMRLSAFALTFFVFVPATRLLADERDFRSPSLDAQRAGGATQFVGGNISTGFEPPQFLPGSIIGQQGWDCSSEAIVTSLVATFNPDAGEQHLRLVDNTAISNSTRSFVLSPQFDALSEADVTVRYAINNVTPGPDGGAEYEFVPQNAKLGFVVTRMVLAFTGEIFVLDDVGNGPEFIDTGATWATGAYHSLSIAIGATGLKYFHDEQLIYSGNLIAATSVDQIVLQHDNFEAPEETGDFDNLEIKAVPEPASAMIFSLVAGLRLRRRR